MTAFNSPPRRWLAQFAIACTLIGSSIAPLHAQEAAAAVPDFLRGLRLDISGMTDSNVTRSNLPGERRSDQSVGVQLGATKVNPMGSNSQMVINGYAGLEEWRQFRGLSKAYLGVDIEFQYRTSADFDAPTFGLTAGATAENHQSAQRDGMRASFGANVRTALTDRINLFAALGHNLRSAASSVFETKDSSMRLNLDYAYSPAGTLYLSGEYRRGDIVSSGLPSLANLNLAKVLVVDDALGSVGYSSYRFAGRTVLYTLGYNYGLGNKGAVDLSLRRIRSDPSASPGVPVGGPSYYVTNQISLVYLKSF